MKVLLYCIFIFFATVALIQPASAQAKTAYYCPPCNGGCDTTAYTKPGTCPHCGMTLVLRNKTKQRADTSRPTVAFYLQNGVEVLDFAGPMEVFSYAGFNVITVSKTKAPITSQGILKVIPDYSIDDAPKADILAFFGGSAGNATSDAAVISWVKNAPTPAYYFSVCTGAFILAKAGILIGLTATTFHESIKSLQQSYPSTKVLSNVRFVDNGKVITTAGISAGIDGALYLVSKIRDKETAAEIAKYMEYDKWVPGQGLIIPNAAVTVK